MKKIYPSESCKYCGKDIKIKVPTLQRGSMNGHVRTCSAYKKHITSILTRNFLEQEYVINGKSANQIHEEFDLSVKAVIEYLKKYGIPTRSISASKLQPVCKARNEATNMKNSGYKHNFCKDHPSRKSWEERLWLEEGITNVFQRQEIVDIIAQKIVENPKLRKPKFGSRFSTIHKKVYDFLNDLLKTEIILEYKLSPRFFDIYIPSYNIIIETNGDIFHANPSKYKASDILVYPRNEAALDIWLKDKEKIGLALKKNIDVLVLWELDIKHNWSKISSTLEELFKGNDNERKNQICEESRKYLRTI